MAGNLLTPKAVAERVRSLPDLANRVPVPDLLDRIQRQGLPTLRQEEWRHNRRVFFRPEDLACPPPPPPDLPLRLPFRHDDWITYPILNGYPLSPASPEITFQTPPAESGAARDGYHTLNRLFTPGDHVLRFSPRSPISKVYVPLLNGHWEQLTCPAVDIRLEEGATVDLFLHHLPGRDGVSLRNTAVSIHLGRGARLRLFTLDETAPDDQHLTTIHIVQEGDSHLGWVLEQLTGGRSRWDLSHRLQGEGAELELDGLGLLSGSGEGDLHSVITHHSPHTTSRETVKNILPERSHGIFNGKVIVDPGAVKTDARQSNRNLLLSADARMHSNPQLEIYADDVRCSHGSATGQLDPDQLFYLRSRGLTPDESRSLLLTGFARDILDRLPWEEVRSYSESTLHAWMTDLP
ncbi:MAG: Fe-S cluster assembly protein SufD [Candidatus Neomarinimicrobiota bacterium]|nr:MAG: Fe-S cluster assembly protein SufD [Candidatus Neomarinimicrobiota bacterium]